MPIKQSNINKSSTTSALRKEGSQSNIKLAEPIADTINLNMLPDLSHPLAASHRQAYFTRLQQTHGNQLVQRMIDQNMGEAPSIQRQVEEEEEEETIQAKLNIGQPGDKYEQEADRVAEQVMRMPEPQLQRQPEEEEEELIQTKPLAGQITPLVQKQIEEEEEKQLQAKDLPGQTSEVSPNLESRINAIRGGGQPLSASTRAFFEPRFGHDFSQVRIHTDTRSTELAQAVKARAFTVGRDIMFNTREYKPETTEGKRLLAHELTHTIHQGVSPYWGQSISLSASSQDQIQWGSNTENADTDYYESAWGAHPEARSGSVEAPSWGASAASQAIARPEPVSWGTMHNMGEAKQGIMGAATSGPPAATDLLTVQTHAGGPWFVGWTYFPKKFKAPNFRFNTFDASIRMRRVGIIRAPIRTGPPRWFARPTLTARAFEGDAESFFVSAGMYKTKHKEGGKDVFWNVSAAMSARDRNAEQEHCDDHAYAYKISLKEAEDVLTAHVISKHFGPKPTRTAAEQMVLDTIKNNLTHPQLGNDKTKWAAKYDMLFRKTRIRDTKGWHTFGLGNRNEIKDKKGNVIKVTYDLNKGTTKINEVKSKAIIKY